MSERARSPLTHWLTGLLTHGLLLLALRVQGANLIPNSSFECGPGRGWLPFTTGNSVYFGNNCFINGQLTNIAFHGGTSFCILTESRLQSRAIWVTNGGTYCLSYYARTASGSAGGAFYAGVMTRDNLTNSSVLPPQQNGSMTGSWARYSTNYTSTSNQFVWVKCYHGQPTVLIDAIQLEVGTSPTTYAPQSTIEAGIVMGGTDGMFCAGDTPTFNLTFRNEGAATTARSYYEVFDMWNSNVLSGAASVALAAATNTSMTVTLPSRTGWFRIQNRLLDYNDSSDEAKTVVYPYVSNLVGHATNDWLGGHPQGNAFHVQREGMAARHFGRTLSPNFLDTRWDLVEPTRGNKTFYNVTYTPAPAGGMWLLGALTPTDGVWPTWATNADGSADLMAWSNFCFFAVLTNKASIKYWSVGPNESLQSGPHGFGPYADTAGGDTHAGGTNLPINVRVATNYARVLSYGIAGITNADPTAKILAMSGASGAGEWAWEVWTNLTANIQSWITAIETHQYPQDQSYDPNQPFYSGVTATFSNPAGWISAFTGVRPVWNTESAAYGAGYHQGLNGMWPGIYDPLRNFAGEGYIDDAVRSEALNRPVTETVRILGLALDCIGRGFDKYFYYDCRDFGDSSFEGTQPYATDFQQVDRPEVVSLSIATHFFRHGTGPITNTSSIYMQMYAGTNASGQSVVTAWSADRTNRTVTFTNSNFAQYDCMGNQGQTNSLTARVTRVPQYFVSGTLSLVQLSNTFAFATVALAPDVLAPRLSFDIVPSGLWSGDTNRQLFKWSAPDDTAVAWSSNLVGVATPSATNVVYKWKMDATGTYNSYSQSNHVWIANLAAGNHTLFVTASDRSGNAQEYAHTFSPSAVTNRLEVSGTARIGTITVP